MNEFRLDWQRAGRTGTSEAVLCEPKSAAQIDAIVAHATELGRRLLLTRLGPRKFSRLSGPARDGLDYDAATRTAILGGLPAALPRFVVHNKIDLAPSAAARAPRLQLRHGERHLWLSPKTGEGVDLLRQEVLGVAGVHEDMEGTFLARERHLVALRGAAAHLDAAGLHLDAASPPLELFAEELREAQQALAEITGEFTPDDLLGVIFSRFCIGK